MEKVKYTSEPESASLPISFMGKFFSISAQLMWAYTLFVTFYLFVSGINTLDQIPATDTHVGFEALSPRLLEYKVFRSIGYFIFICLLPLGGLVTFITKEPVLKKSMNKLIVTLILLTFSFSIATLGLDIIHIVKRLSTRV